ncbi:DUF7079 family protein [Pseudomonas chlororaphis]|uniref:DUF7079 domain-containing protein n=2 Tax=Pseudomonas chlororaphis TaxID=587753 RepID=A0AAX3G4K2_9PSED|nr:hypothetical protein [Pseudomonas chlororaphis]AZC36877.1 hypothetical protein C4K37_2490 [Pseudomonas chlororaphis subsp. piscium]AZC43423.1 hypothetical protein C4K36_2498 [Pseudomonas chlororaphis subsp. piscium]WDG75297.1 hypothetical protein PUP65_13290 [Pseudomonas chlororaphis]WDH27067.1 hypothetical protein PUP81_21020 [Pseudomonas chlororaphis]WDH73817.1 hypothetical protein PUP78_13285 [Pseudomonas chlororaphis]
MTDEERSYVYWALSDAFVDTEVDYEAIARQTEAYDPEEIKRILYHEVAPVCHTNLETVIPMIWSAFNLENLEKDIKKTLKARNESYFRQKKDKLLIRWLEFRYKYIWLEIAKHYKNSPTLEN